MRRTRGDRRPDLRRGRHRVRESRVRGRLRGIAAAEDRHLPRRPSRCGDAPRAGMDVVNLANNHAGDYGDGALLDTLHFARRNGIARSAPAWNRRGVPAAIVSRLGLKVAFVGFSTSSPRASAPAERPERPGRPGGVRRGGAKARAAPTWWSRPSIGASSAPPRRRPRSGRSRGRRSGPARPPCSAPTLTSCSRSGAGAARGRLQPRQLRLLGGRPRHREHGDPQAPAGPPARHGVAHEASDDPREPPDLGLSLLI